MEDAEIIQKIEQVHSTLFWKIFDASMINSEKINMKTIKSQRLKVFESILIVIG